VTFQWVIRDLLLFTLINIKIRKISRTLDEIFINSIAKDEKDKKMISLVAIKKQLKPRKFMINKIYSINMGVLSAVSLSS
jgi:hypothetical protein